MNKNPRPGLVPSPVLTPCSSHEFLTPLQQTPTITVKHSTFQVQTPTDVEHLRIPVEADKRPVEVASPGRSETFESEALATPEHGIPKKVVATTKYQPTKSASVEADKRPVKVASPGRSETSESAASATPEHANPDEVVPTTQYQPMKSTIVEADKRLVKVASSGQSETSESAALATPEHGSPKEVVPKTQAQSIKSANISISEQKSAVEILPPGISVHRRNQVVPVSNSTMGFETTQETRQEEQKYVVNCDKLWQLCTQLTKGQALCPIHCSDKCHNLFAAVWLLTMSFFLFAGMQVLAPNMTEVAREFNYTDAERDLYIGGFVPLAFFVIGGPTALLLGYLTDRTVRRNLFVLIVVVGEIPCFWTIYTTTFWGLIITRAFTGIAMAGAEPLILSMLSDMYNAKARAYVATCVAIGQGAGILIGSTLAGAVGPHLGWRAPFAIVSLPALVVAVVVLLFVNEPRRGAQELAALQQRAGSNVQITYDEKINCKKFCRVFTIKTNLLLYIAETPSCVPWGVMMAFMIDYLAQDRQFGVGLATAVVSAIGIGVAIGGGVGGVVGQILSNRFSSRPWVAPAYVATCLFVSMPFLFWILNADYKCPVAGVSNVTLDTLTTQKMDDHFLPVFPYMKTCEGAAISVGVVGCFGSILFSVPGANIRAWILNTNTPETRGTATSIINIVSNVGKGLGPLVASAMIVAFNGRQHAFNVSVTLWLITCLFYYGVCFTLDSDSKRVQRRVARAHNISSSELDSPC